MPKKKGTIFYPTQNNEVMIWEHCLPESWVYVPVAEPDFDQLLDREREQPLRAPNIARIAFLGLYAHFPDEWVAARASIERMDRNGTAGISLIACKWEDTNYILLPRGRENQMPDSHDRLF